MKRVVSLLPSSTEIVSALGVGPWLVGRSHECDFPPGVERLPPLTESKLDPAAGSAAIDDRVREILSEGLSVYRVDPEALAALRPDVVITQTQCEVCAASMTDVEAALAGWTGSRPELVALQPATLDDVLDDIIRIGDVLGVGESGRRLVRRLEARIEEVTERARATEARPGVAFVEWVEPLMAAGNWVPELIERAGGHNLFGEAGEHSPWMEWDDLVAADPEVIVIGPCGFDMVKARTESAALVGREGWSGLRAVREGRVYLTDGHHYFNRPGPRLVESLEILAEVLHPEAFAFGHEGKGWARLSS